MGLSAARKMASRYDIPVTRSRVCASANANRRLSAVRALILSFITQGQHPEHFRCGCDIKWRLLRCVYMYNNYKPLQEIIQCAISTRLVVVLQLIKIVVVVSYILIFECRNNQVSDQVRVL